MDTNRMITKKEAQKWADALRSGKFKQTTGCLQDSNGYCCLGVACEIFIPENKKQKDERGELCGAFPDGQRAAPRWLKDISSDLDIRLGTGFSALNDVKEFTFDMIADIIELVYVHKAL